MGVDLLLIHVGPSIKLTGTELFPAHDQLPGS